MREVEAKKGEKEKICRWNGGNEMKIFYLKKSDRSVGLCYSIKYMGDTQGSRWQKEERRGRHKRKEKKVIGWRRQGGKIRMQNSKDRRDLGERR